MALQEKSLKRTHLTLMRFSRMWYKLCSPQALRRQKTRSRVAQGSNLTSQKRQKWLKARITGLASRSIETRALANRAVISKKKRLGPTTNLTLRVVSKQNRDRLFFRIKVRKASYQDKGSSEERADSNLREGRR